MKTCLNTDWTGPITVTSNSMTQRAAASWLPPRCRTIVVACGGSALMAIPLRPVEIYNDLGGRVHNFFRAVRDPQQRRGLLDLIAGGAASLELALALRPRDPVTLAYQFYLHCRESWVPDLSGRGLCRRHDSRAFTDTAKLSNPILQRFYSAQIEDLSPGDAIRRYDTHQTAHLVDLSLVNQDTVSLIMTSLQSIRGKAAVIGAGPSAGEQLTGWRHLVEPFGTALVNFPLRKARTAA